MNALNPEKVWVLTKCEDGFSTIRRASEYEFVKELSEEGVPLGDMWYSLHLEIVEYLQMGKGKENANENENGKRLHGTGIKL